MLRCQLKIKRCGSKGWTKLSLQIESPKLSCFEFTNESIQNFLFALLPVPTASLIMAPLAKSPSS